MTKKKLEQMHVKVVQFKKKGSSLLGNPLLFAKNLHIIICNKKQENIGGKVMKDYKEVLVEMFKGIFSFMASFLYAMKLMIIMMVVAAFMTAFISLFIQNELALIMVWFFFLVMTFLLHEAKEKVDERKE